MPAVALDLLAREFRRLVHRRIRPAGNRGDDADRVSRLERRLFTLEMTDVLVVDVHVHEAAQLAVVVVEMTAKVAVLCDERLEQLSNGAAVDFHDILPVGERPERCRNHDPVSHCLSSRSRPVRPLAAATGDVPADGG
jgi:hypothetical protein